MCVFCEIIEGTGVAGTVGGVPTGTVVYADDVAVAFLDRSPLFHGHTLVVPRRHVVTLTDLAVDEVGPFFERVHLLAAAVPVALGAQGSFVANNNVVSQSVAHLHVHVVPRTKGDGLRGFFWPRQKYSGPESEQIATLIRDAAVALRPW